MKKIFIIHGWTYTKDAWTKCTDNLRLAGFEPIMLSVPGLSEASEEVWTLEKYVEWLGKKLQNEQKVTLIGHSNGGRIAIAYAAGNPDKVSNLILVASAGIVHNEFPLRLKRAIFGSVAKVGKTFVRSLFIRKVFYRLIGARDYELAPQNMRETMKNLISTDLTDRLPKVSSRTLIIWGDKDTATPVSDAYLMNNGIQGSKLKVVAGAGHSPHKTHPDLVSGEIEQFIG